MYCAVSGYYDDVTCAVRQRVVVSRADEVSCVLRLLARLRGSTWPLTRQKIDRTHVVRMYFLIVHKGIIRLQDKSRPMLLHRSASR